MQNKNLYFWIGLKVKDWIKVQKCFKKKIAKNIDFTDLE